MYIYKRLSKDDFISAFETHHNGLYRNNFTNEALGAIYSVLIESDTPVALDVIAVCCEYGQTSDQEEIARIKDAGVWHQEFPDGSVVYASY